MHIHKYVKSGNKNMYIITYTRELYIFGSVN